MQRHVIVKNREKVRERHEMIPEDKTKITHKAMRSLGWDPNPIGLVSSQEEEESQQCLHAEKRPCENKARCLLASQGERALEKPNLGFLASITVRKQTLLSKSLVHGVLSWPLWQTNTCTKLVLQAYCIVGVLVMVPTQHSWLCIHCTDT